jgi:nicotinamidase/pyrazinamidase
MKKIKVNYFKTAAFDIDAQNGFTPVCPNELPINGGEEIVEECMKNHTKANWKVMSKDAHPPKAEWTATEENPQFSPVYLPNVDLRWNNHCVVGSKGFNLLDGLSHPSEYDYLVYKGVESDMHPYSPIYHDLDKCISTGIIEWAICRKIKTFIVGGLALDYCLKEGVLDLCEAGFKVIVNLAATRAVSEEIESHIKDMKDAGAIFVANADEIISNVK